MKDYYKILGVEKNATQDEIKKAFKELAKKYHPDKGGSEERFKEINEAYSILSNPDKQRMYDYPWPSSFDSFSGFFNVFSHSGNPRPTDRPMRGRDLGCYMEVSLYESICGGDKEFRHSFKDTCPKCKGIGGINELECQECKGAGFTTKINRAVNYQMVNRIMCSACKGRRSIPQDKCEACNGSGGIDKDVAVIIKLQPNMLDGSVLRVAKKGYSGKNNGPNGNLLIKLQIKMPKKEDLTEKQLELLKTI